MSFKSVLVGLVSLMVLTQPVFSQCPSNIQDKSSKITGILGGFSLVTGRYSNYASGTIFAKRGATYYGLTASHSVSKELDPIIFTISNKRYDARPISINKEYDIAIFELKTSDSLSVAELSSINSQKINNRDSLFISGYSIVSEAFQCLPMRLTETLQERILTYDVKEAELRKFNGMSGGSILDKNGKLIGIKAGANSRSGVSLKTILKIMPPEILKLINSGDAM